MEEMPDGCPTLEPVSIATLCDDVAEGVQAYSEQQWRTEHLLGRYPT